MKPLKVLSLIIRMFIDQKVDKWQSLIIKEMDPLEVLSKKTLPRKTPPSNLSIQLDDNIANY